LKCVAAAAHTYEHTHTHTQTHAHTHAYTHAYTHARTHVDPSVMAAYDPSLENAFAAAAAPQFKQVR